MDVKVIESGNGGELVKLAKDLAVINGFQNMVYLALFGGNVRASTPITRLATEQAFDWWANNLFMPQDSSIQFNSDTERTLNTTALNSSGRKLIQQAVEKDLAFMKDFATVIIVVSLLSDDKVAIGVRLVQPDNLQKQDFIFIWSATKQELLDDTMFTVTYNPNSNKIFDFSFSIDFE
jgi:hypothetical protein